MPRLSVPVGCPECGLILQYGWNLKRHWLNIHIPKELKCHPCLLHFPSAEEAKKHRVICPKTVHTREVEGLNEPAKALSTKMNFFDYDHPLMKIPSLDAPANTRGRKKRRAKRWTLPLIPRKAPQRTLTMVTRSHAKVGFATTELKLSDSESDDSEDGKRQPEPVPISDDGSTNGSTSDEASTLVDDLQLSSDDESHHSDTSEMAAPSASEPLLQEGLIGEGYFWIHPAPGSSVVEQFRNTSLNESTSVVTSRFKQVCRDWSIDRACLMFADKLKPLPVKRCIEVLGKYYNEFEYKFFTLDPNSMEIFGRMIMTLVLHYYRKSHFEVAGHLLKFLISKAINPLTHSPVQRQEDLPLGPTIPEEAALIIMCCTVYLEIRAADLAVNLIMKALTDLIQKNNLVALDALKFLLHRMFNDMIKQRNNTPLLKLFKHIYHTQVDTNYPIDLSVFYDSVLSSLVASSIQDEQKLAVELFESIKFSLLDTKSSEIPSRGLLIVAAEQKMPRARLAKIHMSCLNKGGYPSYDFDNFSLKFYSSMSKIEMQVYLEQFLFYCAIRVKSGLLNLKPCMQLEIVVTPNTARNYKYPVHRKILNVNHSYDAALSRLFQVLHRCLNVPSSIPMQHILQPYGPGKYIMFEGVVDQMFRHVLKVDDVETFEAENCIFCYNCT